MFELSFLAAFLLAATMGMALAALVQALKPDWSKGRRLLVAAGILPIVTVVAALALAAYVRGHGEPQMADLASNAIIRFGAIFALIAFIGSLAGAALSRAGRR